MSIRSSAIGLAVVVVLMGAGAAQSLAGSNTVTSDDIVDFSIVANDIKTAAIGGRPIVDNSMTGTDVNESTLVLTCPIGLTKVGDICYGPPQEGATLKQAMDDCAGESLRLPTLSEGWAMSAHLANDPVFWVDSGVFADDALTTSYGTYIIGSNYDHATIGSLEPYRCVSTVGARP